MANAQIPFESLQPSQTDLLGHPWPRHLRWDPVASLQQKLPQNSMCVERYTAAQLCHCSFALCEGKTKSAPKNWGAFDYSDQKIRGVYPGSFYIWGICALKNWHDWKISKWELAWPSLNLHDQVWTCTTNLIGSRDQVWKSTTTLLAELLTGPSWFANMTNFEIVQCFYAVSSRGYCSKSLSPNMQCFVQCLSRLIVV